MSLLRGNLVGSPCTEQLIDPRNLVQFKMPNCLTDFNGQKSPGMTSQMVLLEKNLDLYLSSMSSISWLFPYFHSSLTDPAKQIEGQFALFTCKAEND